jgi:hypothetical protein
MIRRTVQELAELEASIEAFPTFRAMGFASRLSEAYAEIDRLNGVVTEFNRDMNGTMASLEAERRKNAEMGRIEKAGDDGP